MPSGAVGWVGWEGHRPTRLPRFRRSEPYQVGWSTCIQWMPSVSGTLALLRLLQAL